MRGILSKSFKVSSLSLDASSIAIEQAVDGLFKVTSGRSVARREGHGDRTKGPGNVAPPPPRNGVRARNKA